MQGRPRCKPAIYTERYTDFDQVPVMMTVKEASILMSISERTILNHIEANIIEAIKVGKEWRIPKEQWRYQKKKSLNEDVSA